MFTFKESVKYTVQNGSKVFCAPLDASKAFDKVFGLFVKLIKSMFHLGLYDYTSVA